MVTKQVSGLDQSVIYGNLLSTGAVHTITEEHYPW